MLLRDACTPDVVCCGPQTRVTEAAHLMRQRHVGDLVVVDDPDGDRIPLGVVTDRDIVVEVLGNDLDPGRTKLTDIMRTPVVIAAETEDTMQVIERMRMHGVRRIPVVGDGGKLVGVVTLDDLLKQFAADTAGADTGDDDLEHDLILSCFVGKPIAVPAGEFHDRRGTAQKLDPLAKRSAAAKRSSRSAGQRCT